MRYVFTLFATSCIVLALGAAINGWFDPFGVWRGYEAVTTLPPHMRMKPGIDADPRFAKPLQVITLKPQTIIVGSSRVRDGMDPGLLTRLAPAPVMNYGVAGLRAREGARFIRHAIDVAQVKCVVWGLDFFGFNDREMDEMGADGFGVLQSRPRTQDMARLLLAWPTLSLSGDIIDGKGTTLPNGFNLAPATPESAIDASILRNAVGFAKAPFLYGKFDSYAAHLRDVEATLDYAARKGVTVYLYTSPLHGLVMEAIFQAGADKIFYAWKRDMAALAEKYRMPAVDYMTYNSITTAHGAAAAELFFDGAHFTPKVSRMILGEWFALETHGPDDFGVRLSPDTVDAQWQRLLRDRRRYAEDNAHRIQELTAALR